MLIGSLLLFSLKDTVVSVQHCVLRAKHYWHGFLILYWSQSSRANLYFPQKNKKSTQRIHHKIILNTALRLFTAARLLPVL